jgi:hypothetical protein
VLLGSREDGGFESLSLKAQTRVPRASDFDVWVP